MPDHIPGRVPHRDSPPYRALAAAAGTIGGICLIAWLPALVVLGVVLSKLQDTIAPEWAMLSLVLLPIGWLLSWTAGLLRHRWLRTRETRSDLAGLHGMTAFVLAVVLAPVVRPDRTRTAAPDGTRSPDVI